MTTASQTIAAVQTREGWTDATVLAVLRDYLDQAGQVGGQLAAYLAVRSAQPDTARYIVVATRTQKVLYAVDAASLDQATDLYPDEGHEIGGQATAEYFEHVALAADPDDDWGGLRRTCSCGTAWADQPGHDDDADDDRTATCQDLAIADVTSTTWPPGTRFRPVTP